MNENSMTLDEFNEQVQTDLARFMKCDANSEAIATLMSDKDSQDIINLEWKASRKEDRPGRSRREIQLAGAAAAANCISML